MTEPLLTTHDVVKLLAIQPQTLYYWRTVGKGPRSIKLGDRLVRYKRSDVEAWIDQQQVGAAQS